MIQGSGNIKKIILMSAVALYALTVAGCGAAGVDLSDEDAKKVANYSSDVVSQHNDKSDTRLVSLATVKKKYQEQLDLEIKRQNFRALEQGAEEAAASSDAEGSGEGSESGEGEEYTEPDISLSEAIGVPEFDVYYTDHEISPSYPTSGSMTEEDVYMGMTAAPGDTLLIMHFNISNTEGLDRQCDIIDLHPTFRIKINGENHTVQQTILPDDLSKYDGTVPAYSSVEAVLIAEVQESVVSDVQSLSLVVRSAESRPEYKLE
ncbi:MAG: hypothetical protein IJU43_10315 [Lachnospiraceae bacterium]|nr:hypothetical protein [Lachnospiraceae bacterium]